VALALKTVNPDIKIIGVSPKVSPPMFASLKAGKPVEIEEKDSLADALLGGIGLDNRYTFSMVRALVDDMVLVEEDDIARGMIFAYEKHRLVIEGSGGVGLSALLKDRVSDLGENIVVVVSGGNVGIELHHEIMCKHYHEQVT
jgi:threonine dehydratase